MATRQYVWVGSLECGSYTFQIVSFDQLECGKKLREKWNSDPYRVNHYGRMTLKNQADFGLYVRRVRFGEVEVE